MTSNHFLCDKMPAMPIRLLLIEDEPAIRDLIRHTLPDDEFSLMEAASVKQAEQQLTTCIPDLMIVDWMLPGKSGVEFIAWLREQALYQSVPVILLSAKAEERHKVEGLMRGADDYLTKPFSPAELVARIKSVLRRGKHHQPAHSVSVGLFQVNEARHHIHVNGGLLKLRPLEYKLLHFFITHPAKVFTREQLLNFIWGMSSDVDERTVDAAIKRLREKLKPHGQANAIQTRRGSGYMFEVAHD
jgi:two-component system phosphate regulon response regulator PhoB